LIVPILQQKGIVENENGKRKVVESQGQRVKT